jgi:hypothetical protein
MVKTHEVLTDYLSGNVDVWDVQAGMHVRRLQQLTDDVLGVCVASSALVWMNQRLEMQLIVFAVEYP